MTDDQITATLAALAATLRANVGPTPAADRVNEQARDIPDHLQIRAKDGDH